MLILFDPIYINFKLVKTYLCYYKSQIWLSLGTRKGSILGRESKMERGWFCAAGNVYSLCLSCLHKCASLAVIHWAIHYDFFTFLYVCCTWVDFLKKIIQIQIEEESDHQIIVVNFKALWWQLVLKGLFRKSNQFYNIPT